MLLSNFRLTVDDIPRVVEEVAGQHPVDAEGARDRSKGEEGNDEVDPWERWTQHTEEVGELGDLDLHPGTCE